MKHSKGKPPAVTYRTRLVLERCLHTAIGNWQDTQEIDSRIFFGVSANKSEIEKSFIRGCKALRSHDDLLKALERIGKTILILFDNADSERFSCQDAKDSDRAYSEGKFRGLEDAAAKIDKIINEAIAKAEEKK